MTRTPLPSLTRRRTLAALGALALAPLAGCASRPARGAPHVVVVGGGFAGATAARHLRLWSAGRVAVTLVEKAPRFVSCPLSNLVLGGALDLDALTLSYQRLSTDWGVTVIQGEATAIDPQRRRVVLADGRRLPYDRAILAPGVAFRTGDIAGLAGHEARIPHAWHAGAQTTLLRQQLAALPEGSVVAMHIPRAPYRCPPGPYERACLIAHDLRTRRPRAKLLVFDANSEIQSKKAFFTRAFTETYRGIIEYRPDSTLLGVDAARLEAEFEFDTVRADVLNVIPPMRAGHLVDSLGIPLVNERWVDVDWRTMEVRGVPGLHVIGDATLAAPGMPKSGHMANQHAKHAAGAILDLLADRPPPTDAVLLNTCYSFVDDHRAVHIASAHRLDPAAQTFMPVTGAGGLSERENEVEGRIAHAWARAIWRDTLG